MRFEKMSRCGRSHVVGSGRMGETKKPKPCHKNELKQEDFKNVLANGQSSGWMHGMK